ncbi:MAG TPA: hypothetical protein VGZ04_07095 [Acidimicrobiales bacterium]|jgi:hypothetical protein|nr:hypothetical protein [Acidimicrobiales bacterium]
MNESEPTNPIEMSAARSVTGMPIDTPVKETYSSSGFINPSPVVFSPDWSPSTPELGHAPRSRGRRLRTQLRRGRVVTAAVMSVVLGLSVGLMATQSASAGQVAIGNHSSSGSGFAKGGSNARSGPAAGGSSGTITSLSKSSFTLTTSAAQKVTVTETSATKYLKKTTSIPATDVKKGASVLVLGTVNGTTIKATQVIVQTASTGGSSSSKVIPFQQGAPTASKQVGTIPSNWSQGSGTIVSGTAANKATEAALASYPGGIVDRVVKLSNGEYNVHYIGVNWPHHVFLNQNFKVIGAL